MRLPRRQDNFGAPLGAWTRLHSLGAAVVLLIVIGIAANIWPGWSKLGTWWSA